MNAHRLRISTLLTTVLLATAASAGAVQILDFDGQAVDAATVGDALTVRSIITNGTLLEAPLPLDTANYQYTLVVTGLTLNSSGNPELLGPGVITLIEDASTTASYDTPSSFEDGTVILSGTLGAVARTMFTSTLGSVLGSVDWTGGTRLDEIHPQDRLAWTFLVNVSRAASQIEPGYDERWDGKLEPQESIVANDAGSWGELKTRF